MSRTGRVQGESDEPTRDEAHSLGNRVLVGETPPIALRLRRRNPASLFSDGPRDRRFIRARPKSLSPARHGARADSGRALAPRSEVLRFVQSGGHSSWLVLRRLAPARIQTRWSVDELLDHGWSAC